MYLNDNRKINLNVIQEINYLPLNISFRKPSAHETPKSKTKMIKKNLEKSFISL